MGTHNHVIRTSASERLVASGGPDVDIVISYIWQVPERDGGTTIGECVTAELSIYERLGQMAVSATRILDETTLPGVVRSAMESSGWERIDGSSLGCLETWVDPEQEGGVFRDNLVVIVTRFAPAEDSNPAELLDHAFFDGHALPGWESETEDRWPRGRRHSGWTFQSGAYQLPDRMLWTATIYVVHDRGDAAYLVQTTVTLDADGTNIDDRQRFVDLIRSVIFSD